MQSDAPLVPETEPVRQGTAWFILLFWAAQFCLLTAQRMIFVAEDNPSYLLPRVCVTLVGIALSFVIARVFRLLEGRPIAPRILLACGAAILGALTHAACNFAIFDFFMPVANREAADFISYFVSLLQWFWSYLALSGLLLAMTYSFESAERERRIAQLRAVADAAQLRALRYQLNPHFMFNTLNSIAALITRREIEPAEHMVENLADFLRASLSLDPQEDITLDREIALQSLYLAIEAVRFSDRFVVEVDVPDSARKALVPSLVMQPLIENVVKHAVSTSLASVTLTISAEVRNHRLHVCVANTAGDGVNGGRPGTGVGLANVADRLKARYGEASEFAATAPPDGGFAVHFAIPYMEAA